MEPSSATLETRACGWCAETIPADALRCRFCGERGSCPSHPTELLESTCEACTRTVCAKCLQGKRCQDCPPPPARAEQPIEDVDPTRPKDLLDPIEAAAWFFKDPGWGRKLIWGVIMTLGMVALLPAYLLIGYMTRIAHQQHAQPGQLPLPSVDGVWDLFKMGAKHAVAVMLPVLFAILAMCAPIGFVALWAGGPGNPAVALLLTLIVYLGILFLSLVYPLVVPAIEIEHLRTGSVLAGFRFREVWHQMSDQPGDYLLLTIFYWILGTLASAGFIICGIGIILTIPWGAYATGCLLGRYMAHQDARQQASLDLVQEALRADPTWRETQEPEDAAPGSIG